MPILQVLLAKGGKALKYARSIIQADIDCLRYYFSTTVWLPSIAVAALHASVLAWSGTHYLASLCKLFSDRSHRGQRGRVVIRDREYFSVSVGVEPVLDCEASGSPHRLVPDD